MVVLETAGNEAAQISVNRPRIARPSVSSPKASAPRKNCATGRRTKCKESSTTEELRHRPAHEVQGIEHQKRVLQLADLLVRAVDLHGVRIAPEEAHHARALACQVLGVVKHQVDAPRAAGHQEALEALHARRIVEPQLRAVGIEDAQLPPRLLQQPVDRRLEIGVGLEALVNGLAHVTAFSRT